MTYQKKTGLGRGLSALLDDTELVQQGHKSLGNEVGGLNHIHPILLNQIEVNPYQPRTEFDVEALQDLANSIKLQGLIQPITVRQVGQNTYQLISGERRFRASKMAGLTEVPAYVRTANDQQMLEMALIENIQRENLNAMEVAFSLQRMLDECNLKQEELGERVSKNRSTVTNYLRLLKLPPSIQTSIRENKVSMGHARALVSVEDVDKQLFIHKEIISKGLSVRKVEELVRELQITGLKRAKPSTKVEGVSFQYQKVQDDLASRLGTRVQLKMKGKNSGIIEIPFLSENDLNRLLELLDW